MCSADTGVSKRLWEEIAAENLEIVSVGMGHSSPSWKKLCDGPDKDTKVCKCLKEPDKSYTDCIEYIKDNIEERSGNSPQEDRLALLHFIDWANFSKDGDDSRLLLQRRVDLRCEVVPLKSPDDTPQAQGSQRESE
jgi:hypothetical protein